MGKASSTYCKIKRIVEELPPTDCIDTLLDLYDISIIYDSKLNVSGKTFNKNIFIKDDLEYPLICFVKCHEFGHCICHNESMQYSFSMRNNTKKEREANLFAYLLLQKYGMSECVPVNILKDIKDLIETDNQSFETSHDYL